MVARMVAGRTLASCALSILLLGTVMAPARAAAAPIAEPSIRAIQGAGHVSPAVGRDVTGVSGVVTAVVPNGFFLQDPAPSGSAAASSGIFVFTRTAPRVQVGNAVRVDGRVTEFRPQGTRAHLSRTEIDAADTTVTAPSVPLPPPVRLGRGGHALPGALSAPGRHDVERRRFDPKAYALDRYESLEGMRVRLNGVTAVGPHQWGRLPVVPTGTPLNRRGVLPREADPRRLVLSDVLAPLPAASAGDQLPGPVEGILDYTHGEVRLLPTTTPRHVPRSAEPERTRAQRADELAVATLHLGGLDPSAPASRLRTLAEDVVAGLASPDLIAVAGMADNSGPEDDGTVTADQTVAELISAISAAGGPPYDWRSVDPRDNADGGAPGTNIRLGLLFRTDRGLGFVDRPGVDAVKRPSPDIAVRAVRSGTTVRLSHSPGRIAPRDAVWNSVPKPLAAELVWRGRPLIVVNTQWYPVTEDDDPLTGRRQPPSQPTTWRRGAQAEKITAFVQAVRRADPNASVIVAGDLNDVPQSIPLEAFTREAGLVNLTERVRADRRYTAVESGTARALDHILTTPELARRASADIVHRRAERAERAGEREPMIARFDGQGNVPSKP